MQDRFPIPVYYDTYVGHTKERYLKSRVNPSRLNSENNEVD